MSFQAPSPRYWWPVSLNERRGHMVQPPEVPNSRRLASSGVYLVKPLPLPVRAANLSSTTDKAVAINVEPWMMTSAG
jgi:hypothetical protein